jgi:voltage-gated potassium channel
MSTEQPAVDVAPPSPRREWLRMVLAVAAMLGLYFVLPSGQDDDPLSLPAALGLSFALALGLALLVSRRVLRVLEGRTSEDIPGLLTVLALVVVTFSAVYFMLARVDPDQVAGLDTRLDSLYFTLTTLGTVGYGDIHPAGQAARAVACLQLVFNGIFVAGLVRAILYQVQTKRTAREHQRFETGTRS